MERLQAIIKSDEQFCDEPINIVAHSQGTLITLAALQEGMFVDGVIFMGSPIDREEAQAGTRNVRILNGVQNAKWLVNLWSSSDNTARLKGGIGGFGLPPSLIQGNIFDRKLKDIDHYGASGWWNGSWLNNTDNARDTKFFWESIFWGKTDSTLLLPVTKEKIEIVQRKAGQYLKKLNSYTGKK